MTLNYPKIVTLASMGVALDNIDTPSGSPQIIFQPDESCLVFVLGTSTSVIRHYVVDSQGTSYTDSAPDVHALYLNALTNRLYSWNGDNMMELMNTTLGLEQFNDTTNFSQPGMVYHVTTVHQLTSSLTIGNGSTVVFHGIGKFAGAAIQGTNIQFIPDGDNVCFGTGCTFDDLIPRSSWLRATNFGAIPDMIVGEPHSWTFFDLTCDIQERSGTNNYSIWSMIGVFLSDSDGIKFEFNGAFYSYNDINTTHDYTWKNTVSVTNGNQLELYGGKVLFYLELWDCNNIHIHHMKFVGYHLIHDFPTVCNEKSSYIVSHPELSNSCYEYNADGLATCGLAAVGIHAKKSADISKKCEDIHIEFCHFEMREGGVCGISSYSNISDIKEMSTFNVNDCSFDHIYFQPVGSHCANTTIERVFSNYCLQGLDISTCAHDTIVKDCIFLNNASGPKQDTETPEMILKEYSYNNTIDNCLFEMTDRYNLINAARYALSSNLGKTNDSFKISNSKFIINSEFEYGKTIYCRCHNMILENCSFEFNIDPPRADWKLGALFCSGGTIPDDPVTGHSLYTPHLKLVNCHVVNNSRAYYLATHYGDLIDFEAENSHIQSVAFVHAFPMCNSLTLKSCILDFSCHVFVQDTPTISISDSILLGNIGFSCFNLVGQYALNVSLENNIFKSAAIFVNLNADDTGNVSILRNAIHCSSFVNQPSGCLTNVNQSGNVII